MGAGQLVIFSRRGYNREQKWYSGSAWQLYPSVYALVFHSVMVTKVEDSLFTKGSMRCYFLMLPSLFLFKFSIGNRNDFGCQQIDYRNTLCITYQVFSLSTSGLSISRFLLKLCIYSQGIQDLHVNLQVSQEMSWPSLWCICHLYNVVIRPHQISLLVLCSFQSPSNSELGVKIKTFEQMNACNMFFLAGVILCSQD